LSFDIFFHVSGKGDCHGTKLFLMGVIGKRLFPALPLRYSFFPVSFS
jgi:hypothetical protein